MPDTHTIPTSETTVGEIVAADFRTAAVFQEFGIDFCCGGRRTLDEACRAKQVSTDRVLSALERIASPAAGTPQFSEWQPEALIDYIVSRHHAYVRRALPALVAYTTKLSQVHGARHPELQEVAQLTRDILEEMTSHMAKEERILFPYIATIASASREGRTVPVAPFGSVEAPIQMMEDEHESAGAVMARIRKLTSGYTPPADGCTTYRVCLQELQAFESDLHAHVHLENNILFPTARRMAAAPVG